jgi:hypothetical protein
MPRDHLGHVHVESADARRIRRVGLHERRATLGVAAPAQDFVATLCLKRQRQAARQEYESNLEWLSQEGEDQ